MKLWRYYLIGLVKGYALAAGLVLAIFFLFDVISEAESVGSGGYSFLDAAFVVLLKLPTRFVELSPIVAMLGIVYGLGVFSRNVELVAIRTTGISSARMAGVAVFSVLLLYLVVAAIELVGRPLHQNALSFRMLQVAEQGQPVRGDLWIADPAGMVRISDWGEGMQPGSIELFVFSADDQLERYIAADQVTVDEEGLWHFRDARVTDLNAVLVRTETVSDSTWRPARYRNLGLFDLPVQGLSMAELAVEIDRRAGTGEDDTATRLEWYKRWLLPFSGMVFGMFAAAIGLREGERGGLGRHLAIGVLAALVLYLGQQIVLNASLVAGLGPLTAVLLPVALVGVVALALLRRAT
jgi:lipopolysaccharide export system permease protein